MSATYSINPDGVLLIVRWENARKRFKQLKRELNSADAELANAQNALGKWMVPDVPDVTGEQFNIWVEDGLLSAKKTATHDFKVEWRKEPTRKL